MRLPLRRILTALWACWFVLLMNEPGMLHACPMHDGTAPAAAGEPAAHPMPAGHDHHAMSGADAADGSAHQVAQAAETPEHGDHGPAHGCTCLGDCSAGVQAQVVAPPRLAWLADVVDVDAAPDYVERHAEHGAQLRLPYANGPPGVTRA